MYSNPTLQDHPTQCRLLRWIPTRFIVMFLCFCFLINSTVVGDLLRYTSSAWLYIIDSESVNRTLHCNLTKSPFKTVIIQLPRIASYSISKASMQKINQLYFIAQIFFQIPAGYLTDKGGGRVIILVYGITTALIVCVFPILVEVSKGSITFLTFWKFMLGLLAGVLYPAINGLIAHWIPPFRRTTIIGIIHTGFYVGSIISRTLVKLTIAETGFWQTPFYIWAALMGLASITWYYLGYSSPNIHPYISLREKRFLSKSLRKAVLPFKKKKVPFTKILLSLPVWASLINHIGKGCVFYAVYLYSIQFFLSVFIIDLATNLYFGQLLSYSIMTFSTVVSGILCDVLVNRGMMDITTSRKIFANFGAVGCSVCWVTISFVGCDQLQAYCLMMILVAFYGLYDIGVSANDIDLAPNYAATLKGLCRVGEYLSVLTLPLLLNKLTKDNTMQGWRNLFFIIFLIVLTTNMIFTLFGKAREQPWNLSQISTK